MTFVITDSLIDMSCLFPSKSSFNPQRHSNVVVDKVAIGQVFLQIKMFPCPHFSVNAPDSFTRHCHSTAFAIEGVVSNADTQNYSKHLYDYLIKPLVATTK